MTEEEVLFLAREQYSNVQDADNHNRVSALNNLRFVYDVDGGQWDDEAKSDRARKRRPCLTHNKVRKYVAQVANRERINRLAMDTVPVDDLADVEIAKIYDGILRQVESDSEADIIYSTTGEKALAGGFGYWRILTKFAEDSFDQEIYLEGIDNQFSVHLDPEGNYGFIRKPLLEKEFEEQYPEHVISDFDQSAFGDNYGLWYEDEVVFIAEYFKKVTYMKEIASVLRPEEQIPIIVELTDKITSEALEGKGYQVLKTRKYKSKKVKWYTISGHAILEEQEWAGNEIPIIEVKGDEVDISGRKYKRALVSDAKGPQILYNYAVTSLAEKISASPKAPFIVTAEQIKGHELMWNDANNENYPYILYNDDGTGRKPQREMGTQLDSGFAGLLQISDSDIKDTMGLYESFAGEPSNERSGKAINARKQGGEMGTFHFQDNLARAILKTAKQIVHMIPKIYDTERTMRILGEDGKEMSVTINQTIPLKGKDTIINDLSVGKYDVREGVKAWGTRRQEALAGMSEAMQYAPMLAPWIAPLIFKYQDWPGSEEIQAGADEYKQAITQQKPAPQG